LIAEYSPNPAAAANRLVVVNGNAVLESRLPKK